MTDSRKPMIATGIGLLVVAAILLGLWFFSGRASSETAPSPSAEPTATSSEPTDASEDTTEPEPTESVEAELSGDETQSAAAEPAPSGSADAESAQSEPSEAAGEPLAPEYVTDTPEAVESYVPYVGGTMDFGEQVSGIIAPACLPSSYSDQNGTELEYSCMAATASEIIHFGVFPSQDQADAALEGYLSVKPDVSYVYEQADGENWVILLGSDEAFGVLEEFGYAVRTSL